MKKDTKMPRMPHVFFRWYCQSEKYEELHGDLEEFFYERVELMGSTKARMLYFLDVLRCCQPYAWKKTKSQTNSNIAMFKNFYFSTIRNLLKHKSYFLINTIGLAIGIASFIFISLFLANELSYDRFHSNYKNIYRAKSEGFIRAATVDNSTTPSSMAKTLRQNYPEVIKGTRIKKSGSLLVGKGGKKINENGVLYADSAFFDVFDFKLLRGNPKTALIEPRSMVLTEKYAKKYFGDTDAMGRKITVEDSIFYTVTGIVQDIPANSHIQFNMMGSMSTNPSWNNNHWVGGSFYTYVEIADNTHKAALEEKMQELVYSHLAPEIEYYTGSSMAEWEGAGNSVRYSLFPLEDIHLYSSSEDELGINGNISYIYIYSVIGVILLFIAIFNFVNLATAQSTSRAKEVGVRKVMGSTKTSLVYQFVFESILVSSIATVCAVVLVVLLMPSFVELAGKELAVGLTYSYIVPLSIIGLALLVGVMAGFYPAFVLAKFQPADVLKGVSTPGAKSGWLRNFLVVMQFAASVVIIIGTFVVYNQIDFMLTKNLGFDKDQILVVERPDLLNNQLSTFKNDLLANPNISRVVNSKTIPGKGHVIRSYRRKDLPEAYIFKQNEISFGYEETMGLELVSGRFFSQEHKADSNALVINESGAKALGYANPIGGQLRSPWKKGQLLTIIGVVKDYNIESLHKTIEPVSLELMPTNNSGYITIKLSSDDNIRETVQYIENSWFKYSKDMPFQYFFFDQEYQNLYNSESTTGRVFAVFAGLSIFIACLGLIGLISFTASVRKREIGIRKVLGAGITTLIGLLSGQIAKLITVAILVSWPLAYFATDYWLQNFATRSTMSPWAYIVSTLIVVVIGSFAISFQTIKTSRSNPIDSLRQE